MIPERLPDSQLAFKITRPHIGELNLLALSVLSSPSEISDRVDEYLKLLNVTRESTAEDVRRSAISTRRKFEEGGVNATTIRALRWALEKTNDCNNERQFLQFLLNGWSFEQVDSGRSW